MYKNLLIALLTIGLTFYVLNRSDHIDAHNQPSLEDVAANETCTKNCCGNLPSRLPMTFTYYQKTGKLVGGSGNYAVNTHGYSGQGEGYLNPDKQCVVNTGPLPAARYKITYCKNVMHTNTTRPCSFYLEPQEPSKMCGRGDFFIHGCECCTQGDSKTPPVAGCSAGCIVINYENRLKFRVGDTIIVEHYEPKLDTEE